MIRISCQGRWLDEKGLSNNWSEVDYSALTTAEIIKVFTALGRAERFCDGAIGGFFVEGNMRKCLKALEGKIRQI